MGPEGVPTYPALRAELPGGGMNHVRQFKLSLAHERAKGLSYFLKFRFKDAKNWLL